MSAFVGFMAGWLLADGMLRCLALATGHWKYRNKFGYCLDTIAAFAFSGWAIFLWVNK